jgi:hypothetical protein
MAVFRCETGVKSDQIKPKTGEKHVKMDLFGFFFDGK